MRIDINIESDLPAFAGRIGEAIRRGAMRGAVRFQTRAKLAYRADVRKGGLGDRLANTWQDRLYPQGRAQSWHPAVLIYSRAPAIIRGHTDNPIIRHKGGLWLAIPTENTPRRGRRRATPEEVEVMFNQDLIVFPGRGRQALAFVDVVKARSGKGFRKSSRQRTRDGREKQLVLMFVLVRQVTLQKRLDWPRLSQELAPVFRDYLASEIAQATQQ